MRKTAFLFPGQGAQNVGMGRSFYEKYDAVRQYFKTAQEVTGIDVASLCFEENEALNQTEYTQIAMYTTECAILNVLQEKGIPYEAAAGLSLGEYAALTAAGALSFKDGCYVIRRRGIYMEQAVPEGQGSMAAVLALSAKQTEEVLKTSLDTAKIGIANYNCPGQIVISGEKGEVERAAEVLKQADIAHADLAIACTSEDECNMLSCLIARKLGARHTIARVRNPIYYRQIGLLKEDLHLSMAVNPELIVADEISRLLIFPDASQIETFVKGRMELLELPVSANGVLEGMRLSDMYRKFQIRLLVCAVERGEDVRIPDGEYVLKAGDRLHIAASHKDLERFFKANGKRREKIKKVIICGGGRVGYYLAAQLSTLGMQVKIIEENARRCEELCELLPKATIINGDATDHDLLVEEGVEEADAFVALTGMDEENIILSLYAKSQNVDKIVAKVNEDRRARMVEEFGIDSIVSVKTATADAIMSYVRARKNSQASANIETMYQLVDDKVEALEFIIKSATEYTGIPLKDLALKPNNLIVCIGRKRQIILPSGEDCIEVGDSVVVITMEKHIEDIRDIMI